MRKAKAHREVGFCVWSFCLALLQPLENALEEIVVLLLVREDLLEELCRRDVAFLFGNLRWSACRA